MVSNSSIPLSFTVFFILLISQNPSTLAITMENKQLLLGNTLVVQGLACCTLTGNCPGTALAGAIARLYCDDVFGITRIVGDEAILSTTGSFTIEYGGLFKRYQLINIRKCIVRIGLPVSTCTTLVTGVLTSRIQITQTRLRGLFLYYYAIPVQFAVTPA